ncbi:HNH endonuclease [Natronoarchaeum sp. GCM10025321]|uniref:HNH endonuclease n=1 Tax=Natronoarchaeum sp. GCM10025321 TaxID=3252684 RepID=UPI00360E1C06
MRRTALERDNYECQNCGKGEESLGQNPDVHHQKPVREFEAPAEAHSLENLITLCRSCHRLAEEASIMVSAETEK